MQAVLKQDPKIAQCALLRGPFYPPELKAGSIINEDPDAYDHKRKGMLRWMEHSKFFTTNPCLYPSTVLKVGWPNMKNSERMFTRQLTKRGYRFAFLGDGEQWCTHIGEERTMRGY
jgi:hypothetical protein